MQQSCGLLLAAGPDGGNTIISALPGQKCESSPVAGTKKYEKAFAFSYFLPSKEEWPRIHLNAMRTRVAAEGSTGANHKKTFGGDDMKCIKNVDDSISILHDDFGNQLQLRAVHQPLFIYRGSCNKSHHLEKTAKAQKFDFSQKTVHDQPYLCFLYSHKLNR